ncbi:hypothetical protein PUW61_06840 [Lactobacillus crispatus]|uniref:hypothetical protein n=1 Tax=Lactobacillus crispatus TaxID=47770 RepID=UPI0023A988A9|nr:hypothetical protein [Lactobacillus crispatus]WEB23396.1 hypothetical protein PUW61_06840 [Lactobacillus crispatus]
MTGKTIKFQATTNNFKVNGNKVVLQLDADLLTHKINLNKLKDIAFDDNGVQVSLEADQQELIPETDADDKSKTDSKPKLVKSDK